MEAFIDKGYTRTVLEVLNDIEVYMKVVVLSDISRNGKKMANWALATKQNKESQWTWSPHRVPTKQNLKVWRDCLRGTFVKGINDLLEPVTEYQLNCYGHTAFPPFN